jgi:hypothetical protein
VVFQPAEIGTSAGGFAMKTNLEKRGILDRPARWIIRLTVLFAVAHFVGACSTTLQLQPKVSSSEPSRKVPLSVQIDHSPAFVNTVVPVDVYGNLHEFIFTIGQASDVILRATYPKVFEHVSDWVGNYSSWTMPGQSDVILSPKISSFAFPIRGTMGPYFAQITYTFTLSSLDGTKLLEWSVTGEGESGKSTPMDESGPFRLAAEKAMEKADLRFTRSFEEVPEVKRFLTGMSADNATADAKTQKTFADAMHAKTVKGTYDGVVTVEASHVKPNDGSQPAFLKETRITILNEGDHRIVFYPSDVRLVYEDGQTMPPIRGCVVSAAMTTRHWKFPQIYIYPGVGVASLPLFFTSMANAAIVARERQERTSHLRTYQAEELTDMALEDKDASTGLLFFYSPVAGEITSEIIVPVVDVDAATRYVVRLPIKLE